MLRFEEVFVHLISYTLRFTHAILRGSPEAIEGVSEDGARMGE
jgi:hypothetical protein